MFGIMHGQARYANDVEALVPEWWARESLRILDKQTRILPLVDRNYDEYFAEAGDVVNLNKDGNFNAKRKFKGEAIVMQDVKSTSDWLALNQQLHVSFLLDDQDSRRTFGDLRGRYMVRAGVALAEGCDAIMMGETYQFMEDDGVAGRIGTAISDTTLLELHELYQRRNVPGIEQGIQRNLIVGAASERQILDVPRFVEVDKIGDGSPIRTGMIGRVRGFDVIHASQAWEVPLGNDRYVGAVDLVGGYAAGSTTLVVDGFVAEDLTVGSFCLIAGDDTPQRITARTLTGADTTGIAIAPGLRHAVVNDAVITVYRPFTINQANPTQNQASGYDFQSGEDFAIDGFTAAPKLGQGVVIGATSNDRYTITGVDLTNNTITLNRPLDAGVLDGALVFPIPNGNYNLSFVRPALTFVNRPLAPPDPGTGVRSFTASFNGVAIRVTMGYDMIYERMRVTLSTLCGVKTLDRKMGAVAVS